MACYFQIAFVDLGVPGSDTISPPPDMSSQYFSLTYAVGARLHSNSWGSDGFVGPDFNSRMVDTYAFNNQDFLPLFPAGDSASGFISNPGRLLNSRGRCV